MPRWKKCCAKLTQIKKVPPYEIDVNRLSHEKGPGKGPCIFLFQSESKQCHADKNIRGSVFRTSASLRAVCLPMGRLPFSISEI